jgi:hypothetical protein
VGARVRRLKVKDKLCVMTGGGSPVFYTTGGVVPGENEIVLKFTPLPDTVPVAERVGRVLRFAQRTQRLRCVGQELPPAAAATPAPPAPPAVDNAGQATDKAIATRGDLCAVWLWGRLCGGPVRLAAVRADAEEAGFSARSLYGARDRLFVVESTDADGKKLWQLPPDNPASV